MFKVKKNEGITLIALVVTIIVLLILAGVTVSMLTGENGILRQAAKAKEETENAAIKEGEDLDKYEAEIARRLGKSQKEFIESKGGTILSNDNINNFPGNNKLETILTDYKPEGSTIYRKDNKWYVLDQDWNTIEVTEVMKILQKIILYLENNTGKKYTMQYFRQNLLEGNDNEINDIVGEGYNNSNYKLLVMNRRIMSYPDMNISSEKRKQCEAIGIYVLGDCTGDYKVNYDDYDFFKANYLTMKNVYGEKSRTYIVSDIDGSNALNINDYMDYGSWLKAEYVAYEQEYLQTIANEFFRIPISERENIIATTDDEVKKYLDSYDINKKYTFLIVFGDLYVKFDKFEDKNNIRTEIENCVERKMSIYCDENNDHKYTQADLDKIYSYIQEGIDTQENVQPQIDYLNLMIGN